MNKRDYENLLEKYLKRHIASQNNRSILDFNSYEGRYHFATMLVTFTDQKQSALMIMHSIVNDFKIHSLSEEWRAGKVDESAYRYLALAHIFIGRWTWRLHQAFRSAQESFDRALHIVDLFPQYLDLAGKVFYERCLILSEMEKGDAALNMAFEIVDSYKLYGKRLKSKKMFYVYMAIASIAQAESIYDIAIDHLWCAYRQLDNVHPAMNRFIRQQYNKRNDKDGGELFQTIHDHLEQFL